MSSHSGKRAAAAGYRRASRTGPRAASACGGRRQAPRAPPPERRQSGESWPCPQDCEHRAVGSPWTCVECPHPPGKAARVPHLRATPCPIGTEALAGAGATLIAHLRREDACCFGLISEARTCSTAILGNVEEALSPRPHPPFNRWRQSPDVAGSSRSYAAGSAPANETPAARGLERARPDLPRGLTGARGVRAEVEAVCGAPQPV